MKSLILFFSFLGIIGLAALSANLKQEFHFDVSSLKLGMTENQVLKLYGEPFAHNRNLYTYIFQDSSELLITFRDQVVTSAEFKYKNPPKIEDPEMRKLTLVQMQSEENFPSQPKWFFAGKPEDGMIYKITSAGEIESLTWVPPFSYGANRPKQVQALLRDFRVKQTSNL
jgi:hypothetical protein